MIFDVVAQLGHLPCGLPSGKVENREDHFRETFNEQPSRGTGWHIMLSSLLLALRLPHAPFDFLPSPPF